MTDNPLVTLTSLGQSIWMDFIRRGTVTSGELHRYIEADGLRGVTSNPTIFEKAIAHSREYQAPIRALALEGKSAAEMYQAITVEDIQLAADAFRPLFERLDGRDGFVSLEVSPRLAHETAGTVAEARRLWAAVNRPNVMIKVPATEEGLPAIRDLVSEGINVNITLLFGLQRYQQVTEAYLTALESRAARRLSVRVASVASFFLSRIDVRLDSELDVMEQAGKVQPSIAATLRGQVAIASARVAYQKYRQLFESNRFGALAENGARPQRLLWASTSTKNPAYSDVKYVEALIGKDTINTVPLETFDAYRDHGDPALRLEERVDEARALLDELRRTGIDLGRITQHLEDDGVRKFVEAYDQLMSLIAERRDAALHERREPTVPHAGR
jgi:transaldolase